MKSGSPFDPMCRSGDLASWTFYYLFQLSQLMNQVQQRAATDAGLTPLQMRCLLFLNHTRRGACNVSQLTRELGVSQATVSDTVDALIKKGLLLKLADERDLSVKRPVLTEKGQELCCHLERWAYPLLDILKNMPEKELEAFSRGIEALIKRLRVNGLIVISELCSSCGFCRFGQGPSPDTPHWCSLLRIALREEDIRKQCPEHTLEAFQIWR